MQRLDRVLQLACVTRPTPIVVPADGRSVIDGRPRLPTDPHAAKLCEICQGIIHLLVASTFAQEAENPPLEAMWNPAGYQKIWRASPAWVQQLDHQRESLAQWLIEDDRRGVMAIAPRFVPRQIEGEPVPTAQVAGRTDPSSGYAPDAEDRELFRRVRCVVVENPERFREAGKVLDTRYAWRSIKARERKQEARFPAAWRESINAQRADAVIPRASSRNIPYGRLMAAISDLLADQIDFTAMRREERWHRASLVLLVTWLLTDPDAADERLGLTDLESGLWTLKSAPILMPLFRDNAVERDWLSVARAALECFDDQRKTASGGKRDDTGHSLAPSANVLEQNATTAAKAAPNLTAQAVSDPDPFRPIPWFVDAVGIPYQAVRSLVRHEKVRERACKRGRCTKEVSVLDVARERPGDETAIREAAGLLGG